MDTQHSPQTVRVAAQLIVLETIAVIISVTLALTAYYINGTVPKTYYPFTPFNMTIDAGAYFILMGACIYYILQGQHWARIVYTIYSILHALANLYASTLWGATLATDIFVFIYLFLRVISITLLFTPQSNRWFRGKI